MLRTAIESDIPAIYRLLQQVLTVHANGRPDIFKANTAKYGYKELLKILQNDNSPIFVALDEYEQIVGYAFCQYHAILNDNILQNAKYCYIDDLCIDENHRGQYIGTALYKYVLEQARQHDCQSIRLNVWSLNETALKFYQKLGLLPLKTTLEYKL